MRIIIVILTGWITAGGAESIVAQEKIMPVEFDDIVYPVPVQKMTVESMTIAYFDSRKGDETVVLIHGLSSNLSFWRENISALSEKYRVIAVDLPGYGKSNKNSVPCTMAFYADFLNRFLDALRLKKVNMIGQSMGGQIAITFALTYPERLHRLVLAAPAGVETFDSTESALLKNFYSVANVKAADANVIRQNVVNNFSSWDTRFEWIVQHRTDIRLASDFEQWCGSVSRGIAGMLDGPVRSRLGEINVPTLILFGEDDRLIPNRFLHKGTTTDIAEAAGREIPDARMTMIPKAGHLLMIEQPVLFNSAVIEFLQSK